MYVVRSEDTENETFCAVYNNNTENKYSDVQLLPLVVLNQNAAILEELKQSELFFFQIRYQKNNFATSLRVQI